MGDGIFTFLGPIKQVPIASAKSRHLAVQLSSEKMFSRNTKDAIKIMATTTQMVTFILCAELLSLAGFKTASLVFNT